MFIVFTLRQPEYTGENRCWPCTVVNVGIAVIASVLGAAGATWAWTVTAGAAIVGVALFGSFVAIWLRGYLVPGTPRLTQAYLPRWVLTWFGKDVPVPAVDDSGAVDPESTLRDAGVLETCPDADDLCLSAEFDRAMRTELDAVGDDEPDPLALLHRLGLEAEAVTVDRYDNAVVVIDETGVKVGQWPSTAAMQLDIAAADPLTERVPNWESLSPTARSQLLAAVRIFVDECPESGPVAFRSETVESCCSSHEVVTAICADSGERLLEQPVA